MRSSTSGITRSPSVGAVGLSGSPSFQRSLNTVASTSSLSTSASTSRLPATRPMSPEELDSDRDLYTLPKPRKVVGKLSGVGVPDGSKSARKVAAGASSRAAPSTPTSAARRMTGTPAKLPKKAAKLTGKEDGGKERVVVCVRVKPPIPAPCIYDFAPAENLLTLNDLHPTNVKRGGITKGREQEGEFPIDHLHLPPTSTSELYQKLVSPIVTSTVDGYNGTVFAYGMTGSGKTHTMGGVESDPGVIPRSIDQIFDSIDDDKERAFFLRVTYLELYNESLRDLLNPNSKLVPTIHERDGKVCVDNLEEVPVKSPEEVQLQLKKGENNRRVGKTDFNEHSSRSHTIFSIIIESRLIADSSTSPSIPQAQTPGLSSSFSTPSLPVLSAAKTGGVVRLSRLNLIDLAGSEKATSDGDRQKEGGFINKSLLDLATVIEKLTDAKPQSHIPYRNSKLTRLLQDSLSGHARIAVICTISLQEQHSYEALATLKFARRVSRIVTRAEKGTVVPEDALMEYYRSEIADLKRQLAAANTKARGPAIRTLSDESSDDDVEADSGDAAVETRRERLRELTAARMQQEEDVQRLQMERTKLQSQISNMAGFILTSEATPASPIGPAFGTFKQGKSRRRISDLSLGVGRPAGVPSNPKRFASAMTAVEEGPAPAPRSPLVEPATAPEVPSIPIPEHEAALAALQAQVDALAADATARANLKAELVESSAKVESLSATVSDLCAGQQAAAETSSLALEAQKAEFADRLADLESKVAEEEAKRAAAEGSVESKERALADLRSELANSLAAAEEVRKTLEARSEETTRSQAEALADRDADHQQKLNDLRSQLAELTMTQEAAAQADKSRSAEKAAQRLASLEETHRSEIAAHQAQIAEGEAVLVKLRASEEALRSEASTSCASIADLEAKLIEAQAAATVQKDKLEEEYASQAASLQSRVNELESKLSEAETASKARESATDEAAALIANSAARIADLEFKVEQAVAEAKSQQTNLEASHTEASAGLQARIAELEAQVIDAATLATSQASATEQVHASERSALQARIADLEAKVLDAAASAQSQQTELAEEHESASTAMQLRIAELEAALFATQTSTETQRSALEDAHASLTASLEARIAQLHGKVKEAQSTRAAQQTESEQSHLATVTKLEARIAEQDACITALRSEGATQLAGRDDTHRAALAALKDQIARLESAANESAASAGAERDNLAASHKSELAAQKLLHTQLEAKLADVQATLQESVPKALYKSEISSLAARIAGLEKNATAVQAAHDQALLEARSEHEMATDTLRTESEDALKAALLKQATEFQRGHQSELKALVARNAELEGASVAADAAHQQSLDEILRDHAATLQKEVALATAAETALLERLAGQEDAHRSTVSALEARITDLERALAEAEADHSLALTDVEASQAATLEAQQLKLAALEARLLDATGQLAKQEHVFADASAAFEQERQSNETAKLAAEDAFAAEKKALQAALDDKTRILEEQAAAAAERAATSSQWMGMTKSPSIAEGLNLAETGSLREPRRPGHNSNLSYAAPSRLSAGSPQDEDIIKLNQTIKIQRDLIVDLQDKVRVWGEQARKNDRVINELLDEICSGRVPNVQALSNRWSNSASLAAQSPWESLHKRSSQAPSTTDPLTPSRAVPSTPSRPAPSSLRHSALAESSQSNQPAVQSPLRTPSTPKRTHVIQTYVPSPEKPPPLPHASHQRSNSAARAARRITIEHDMDALKATSKVEQSRSVFDSPAKTPTTLRKL